MTSFPVPTMPAPSVGVVGLGQLGGSLAAALVAAGRQVTGWDVDPAAREAAAARGVRITERLDGVVVLAVPLPAMAAALEGLDVDPDATVTDLGSVKAPVLAELGPALGGRYVGGHPMCGTERSGHEATDPGLFTGARWALCLEPGTELPRWLRVAEVALAVGAEVVAVDAAARDVIAAAGHAEHFTHGLGHGVGLEIHEAPGIGQLGAGRLAAGMAVTVEPGVYLPGHGGVRIEDTLIVTDDEPELLTLTSKELLVL